MKCGCCGKEIGEIAFDKSFKLPDDIWNLTEEEKLAKAKVSSDLCSLDERYFLRGVAYIPVNGLTQAFGWGIWAEVSPEQFFEYAKSYEEDNSDKRPFPGKAANHISPYENTVGLDLQVQLGSTTQRPTFIFTDNKHPLTCEQANGISLEKVQSFNNS